MATPATGAVGILSRDEPATEDAFGAHRAIACAIKRLILNSKTGFGIALVGEPGSGKSTVLKLLEGECKGKQPCEIAVFRFEAWAHEGDNLRRAFLLDLADFLDNRGWCKTQSVREKLSPQPSQTWERLTWPALLLAVGLFLLLTPGATLKSGFGLHWPAWARVLGVWGAFVAAGITSLLGGEPQGEPRGYRLSFLARTQTVSVSVPARTSIGFRKLFQDLLSCVELKAGERVLVIALEDFDRLPPREREQAWSVMRTYTEGLARATGEGEKWRDAVWTIVPIKAKPKEDEKIATPEGGNELAGTDSGHGRNRISAPPSSDEPGRADRLCQVEFAVPPALLTRWREFLNDKLDKQLGHWSIEDRNDAVLAYAARLAHLPFGRSPRSLLAYVNELVAIDALRPSEREITPDAVIQLVANMKFTAGSVEPLGLVTCGQAGSRAEVGAVASLLYNRDRGEALVAALGDDVLQALKAGDQKKLSGLQEQCESVLIYADTLIAHEVDTWAASSPQFIGRAALALALGPGILDGRTGWTLAEAAIKVNSWRTIDSAAGAGLGWLCLGQSGLARDIFGSVARVVDAPTGPFDFEQIALSVDRLVKFAENTLPKKISVGASARAFLQFAAALRKNEPAALARFRPACDVSEVVSYLKVATRDEDWVAQISAAALADVDMNWLVPTLTARPESGTSLADAAEFAAAVMVVGHINANDATWVVNQPGRALALLAAAQGHQPIERAIVLGLIISEGSVRAGKYDGQAAVGQESFNAILHLGAGREWDEIGALARDASAKRLLKDSMTQGREVALISYILAKFFAG